MNRMNSVTPLSHFSVVSQVLSFALNPRTPLIGILPLSIHIILLNKPIIIRIRLLRLRRRHLAHAIIRPRRRHLARRRLLGYRITRVDPVGVHVDGRGKVVDVGLEGLAADFALQVADAGFLLDGDGDGFLVVAEEALEGGGELFLLGGGQ